MLKSELTGPSRSSDERPTKSIFLVTDSAVVLSLGVQFSCMLSLPAADERLCCGCLLLCNRARSKCVVYQKIRRSACIIFAGILVACEHLAHAVLFSLDAKRLCVVLLCSSAAHVQFLPSQI
jgi:hypothetical protein